jgi:hypothetical protein
MAKRDVLLGFGAGWVAAAGILFVLPAEPPATAPSLTRDQLRAAAETLDLVVLSKAEYEQLAQENKLAVNQSPLPPKQPQAPQAGVTHPVVTQPPAQPQTAAGSSPGFPTAPQAAAAPITVTIPYKATAEGVARMMAEAGVLPAENSLVETLRSQGKLNRIRVGTYQIRPGATEAEIVRLITTPPKK